MQMKAMDIAVVDELESYIDYSPVPGLENSNRAVISALICVIELGEITNPAIIAAKLRKIIILALPIELVYGDLDRLKKLTLRAEKEAKRLCGHGEEVGR